MEQQEIDVRFTYHPPTETQANVYEELRANARRFANWINALVPESREKSLALTKLEECSMWANAGIARRTDVELDTDSRPDSHPEG